MPGIYQRKDRLYRQAKQEGLRSRAAFKLEELNRKYHFLKRGVKVLDLGCAPGGWLQVSAAKVGEKGLVLGVDLERVEPFKKTELGANAAQPITLVGDITTAKCQENVLAQSSDPVDLILADMSPKLSGIRDRDIAGSVALAEIVFNIAGKLLKEGGTVVTKIFPSPEGDQLFEQVRSSFAKVDRVYLKSTRKTSKELYFVAQGFCRKLA